MKTSARGIRALSANFMSKQYNSSMIISLNMNRERIKAGPYPASHGYVCDAPASVVEKS